MEFPMNSEHCILETTRLRFRRLTMRDLDPLAAFYADPEVMRYVGAGLPRSREETRARLQELIDAEARQGFGVWALLDRADGTFLGRAGLAVWNIAGRREVEILYLLGRPYWGRGLATEAAAAIRDYGLNMLSEPRLISLIYPGNRASQRVAEKAGLRYERDVTFMEHVLNMFSIDEEQAG